MKSNTSESSKLKEFVDESCEKVEKSGFLDAVKSLAYACSELKVAGFSVNVSVKSGEIVNVSVSKRGPNWKIHKIV